MIHKPIRLINLSLSLPHKICFEAFSTTIPYGSRIAIIGRNGSGKSSLLKMLQDQAPKDVVFGYVPQVIEEFDFLSGGQRFNRAFTLATCSGQNVLLLDEPTNHLDKSNRKSLMRMLKSFNGTVIIASHDVELLRSCNVLWHIVDGRVEVFLGNYDDYMREVHIKRTSIELELSRLERQKKDMHRSLMAEQNRASKSRAKGEKSIERKKWPTIVSNAKALRAEETSGRKKSDINNKKQGLSDKLSKLNLSEAIVPKFSLTPESLGHRLLIAVTDGSVGYEDNHPILRGINLRVSTGDRVAITGDNGCGKSSLIKAILNEALVKTGEWYTTRLEEIGYLDQHYATLYPNKTVLEAAVELVPNWSYAEVRRHLNDFLFRKNEEVNATISTLSGGEKARLSLALIAAKTPKLLILDEITNNIDLETREHVIQVLKKYPGAMIVISHDEDFLKEIGVTISLRC